MPSALVQRSKTKVYPNVPWCFAVQSSKNLNVQLSPHYIGYVGYILRTGCFRWYKKHFKTAASIIITNNIHLQHIDQETGNPERWQMFTIFLYCLKVKSIRPFLEHPNWELPFTGKWVSGNVVAYDIHLNITVNNSTSINT